MIGSVVWVGVPGRPGRALLLCCALVLLWSCHHDLAGIGKPCSDSSDCAAGLECAKDQRCVVKGDAGWDGPGADRSTPEASLPDGVKPADGPVVDAALVDGPQPDLPQPDLTKPDLAKPDLPQPDLSQPDLTKGEGVPPPTFSIVGKSPITLASGKGNQSSPAVAVGNNYFLVVWADDVLGTPRLYATRISRATGAIVDSPPIWVGHQTANVKWWPSKNPAVAYYPSKASFVVVWDEDRGSSTKKDDIYQVVIDENKPKPQYVAQTLHANNKPQTDPAIACEMSKCLVAFVDELSTIGPKVTHIRAVRMGTTSVAPFPVAISTGELKQDPAVATDGMGNYLVAWQDVRKGIDRGIWGTLVTSQPYSTYKEKQISSKQVVGYTTFKGPSVAWGAGQFMVVWELVSKPSSTTKGTILGRRLTAAGNFVYTNNSPLQYSGITQGQPTVTGNPGIHAMAWAEQRTGTKGYDLFASRLNSKTTPLKLVSPEVKISGAANDQQNPILVWSSDGYLVVWESYDSGYTLNIEAARISN